MFGDAFAGSVRRVTAVRIKGIAWAEGWVRVGRGAVVWVTIGRVCVQRVAIVAKRPMEATGKPTMCSPVEPTTPSTMKPSRICRPNLEPGDDTKGEKDRHERPQETLLPFHTNIHCRCSLSRFSTWPSVSFSSGTPPPGGHEGPQPEPLVWVSQ